MPELKLVRNDKNYYVQHTIKDASGDVIDITSYVPEWRFQKYGESTLLFYITGEIVTGSLGICKFKITDELQDRSGEFYSEVQLTKIDVSEGTIVVTAPDVFVKVIEDLPR